MCILIEKGANARQNHAVLKPVNESLKHFITSKTLGATTDSTFTKIIGSLDPAGNLKAN